MLKRVLLSYVKWIAGPGLMHETGCSGLVHWDDPAGRDGRRWKGGSGWWTHVAVSDSCCSRFMSMFGKNHQNIVK